MEARTIGCFEQIDLSILTEEWIQSVRDSDFTLFEGENVTGNCDDLLELYGCLKDWAQEADQGEAMWSILLENGIPCKVIVVYLGTLIHAAQKSHVGPETQEAGIFAARVYCQMTLVKGSGAFNLFHPQLFEYVVNLVKLLLKVETAPTKGKKANESQAHKSAKSKKKRKRRASDSMEVDDVEIMDDGEEEEEERELTTQTIRNLTLLLVDVVGLVDKFSLYQHESSARCVAKLLCQLTRKATENFKGDFSTRTIHEKLGIPALAFLGLRSLCGPIHRLTEVMLLTVSKELLPSLLMLVDGKSVQTINKLLQVRQEHALQFVSILMADCGEKGSQYLRALLQHMCIDVPDRAEYRTRVSHAVVSLALKMCPVHYCKLVQWICKLTHHKEVSVRGFAVEVVSELLSTPERRFTEEMNPELSQCITHCHLLQVVLDSCSDDNPTVRARAITTFGLCLSSKEEGIVGMLHEIVTPQINTHPPNLPPRLVKTPDSRLSSTDVRGEVQPSGSNSEETLAGNQTEASTIRAEGQDNLQGTSQAGETMLRTLHVTPASNPYLSDCEGVFSMLRRRAGDVKVNVRKAALQALKNAVLFEAPTYTKQNVEVLRDHCRDPGLSARKQALVSLTELLVQIPEDKHICKMWLDGCMPLVIDRETTMSDKCLDTLNELILSNIVTYQRTKSPNHHLAWNLLDEVAKAHNVDQRRYLQKACSTWCRKGLIKPSHFTSIQSHVGTENNSAALMLMAEVTPALKNVNPAFPLNHWHNSHQELTVEDKDRLLTVLKYVAPNLSFAERNTLLKDLQTRILKFESPTELVAPMIHTLSKLCTKKDKTDFCGEVMKQSDKFLSKIILEPQEQLDAVEAQVVCHLFTLGEVVQLCPGLVPKRIFLIIESMVSAPRITAVPPSQPTRAADTQTHHADEHKDQSVGSEDPSHHESETSQHSQGSHQETQGTQSTQPLSQFRGCVMSPRIRTFAFITLGKLCLQHEKLAKKYLPALANELDTSESPAIRNNVMITICDLSARYTTAANMYIPNIFICLKDPCPLIRKQVLNQVTRLLQDDFIKWKGKLFFRFIITLLDEIDEIRDFGEFCLVHTLLPRHPNLLFQHFVECVFHFNDYRAHKKYNTFLQNDKERQLFALSGDAKAKSRRELYVFMLKHMTDVQKFQVQEKLCQEVLGDMADNMLPLCTETAYIMRDALFILSSKEIKLSSTNTRNTDESQETGEKQNVANFIAAAKKTIYSHYHMKNLLENVVPTVISLKHMLEKKRSPLVKDLLMYLKELMTDYKDEIKDIIHGNKQLVSEIEFAARKFEEEQQTPAQQPGTATPSNQGSPVPGQSPASSAASTPTRARRIPALKPNSGSPLISSPRPRPRIGSPLVQKNRAAGVATPDRATPLLRKAIVQASLQQKQHMTTGTLPEILPTDRDTEGSVPSTSTGGVTDGQVPSTSTGGVTDGQVPSTSTGLSAVGTEEMDVETNDAPAGDSNATPQMKMTRRNHKLRAISTPSVAMGNITFYGENNQSYLPSPIPEEQSMKHVLDESSTSLTPVKDDKENKIP